ncbi:Uncharacterised protein [Klebsiella pneumoniae]|nr:Uncharacterised protein [Klebsiella pneumoniae]
MLELNVSTIRNTVTFVVDKQSIAQAKKAADDLHKALLNKSDFG